MPPINPELPPWFVPGATVYFRGVRPAYIVAEIHPEHGFWVSSEHGDLGNFPLAEVAEHWTDRLNEDPLELPHQWGNAFIIENGHVVEAPDHLTAARWFGNIELRRVGETKDGEVEVSTVFTVLGLPGAGDGPFCFETMTSGGRHDGYCNRYATLQAAVEGHEAVLAVVWGVEAPPTLWGPLSGRAAPAEEPLPETARRTSWERLDPELLNSGN